MGKRVPSGSSAKPGKLVAIKAVRAVAKVSLGQAKEWVSSSAAWRDVAAQSKPLHDDANAVIDSLPSLAPRERMRAG